MHACFACLFLPYPPLFLLFCHWHFSVLLAFRGTFGLSELHGILGVGSGSTSSCTTSQKILLWVLPGMFFAWKCFADVLEPYLWCSLNYPHAWEHRLRMPHTTLLWRELSASTFCSPPPCTFGTFSWWCVLAQVWVILYRWQVKLIIQISHLWDLGWGGRFNKFFFPQKGNKYSDSLWFKHFVEVIPFQSAFLWLGFTSTAF